MKNLTAVSTFTAPVQCLEAGDPVTGANSETTAQALTNRTEHLKDNKLDKSSTVQQTITTAVAGGSINATNTGSGPALQAQNSGTGNAINASAASSNGGYGIYAVGSALAAAMRVEGSAGGVEVVVTGLAMYLESGAGRAELKLKPRGSTPTSGEVGDMYVTTAGVLKICTAAGTPGTWVSVGTQT